MSNQLSIQPTVFENYPDGKRTFGVRIYDNYSTEYTNLWNRDDLDKPALEMLRKVKEEASEEVSDMLYHVLKNQKGVEIGDNWHTWEDIKEVLEDH